MTTQVIIGKLGGTYETPSLPVLAVNDDHSELTLANAVSAVEAQYGSTIPLTILDVPDDGNPGIQRLSYSAWQFVINYRFANLRVLHPIGGAEIRDTIECVAKRRFMRWAPHVATYDDFGVTDPPLWDNGLLANFDGNGDIASYGIWVEPPEPSITREMIVALSTITGSWLRSVAVCVGATNSVALASGGYPAGTLFLHSVLITQISEEDARILVRWAYAPNVSAELRGTISIDYNAHDLVWELPWVIVDRETAVTQPFPKFVVVNQVHPSTDISAIGVAPP